MVAFGGKLLLAMYGSHSGASRLSAFWRVRYRRFHCIYLRGTIIYRYKFQQILKIVDLGGIKF